MFGAFLFPLRHLLFDDSWIDSIAARLYFLLLQFPEQALELRSVICVVRSEAAPRELAHRQLLGTLLQVVVP